MKGEERTEEKREEEVKTGASVIVRSAIEIN